MRTIAIEEHFKLRFAEEIIAKYYQDPYDKAWNDDIAFKDIGSEADGYPSGVYDFGDGRIAAMDAGGLDMQILSYGYPGIEGIAPEVSVPLGVRINDEVAAAVMANPDRLLGFATLPMLAPDAAAAELERTVKKYGFVGALIRGHANGRYLDDPFFWPVFEAAEALDVPIVLHPTLPPKPVREIYAEGYSPAVNVALGAWGFAWHMDTTIHSLRLILGGVFDRFPKLQFVLSHNFEGLAWSAWRAHYSFPKKRSGLQRTIKEYIEGNFYGALSVGLPSRLVASGEADDGWNLAYAAFQSMMTVLGTERILLATDYPYHRIRTTSFLDKLPLSNNDKHMIAHGNAERLFKISPKR